MKQPLVRLKKAAAILVLVVAAALLAYYLNPPQYLLVSNGKTGEEYARYPMKEGERFSVQFIHSVNQSPLTDVYEIRDGVVTVVETIYYGLGAGVQTFVEEGQTLTYNEDGAMVVSGFDQPLPDLTYIVGTVSDHILTVNGEEVSLRDLCGRNSLVRFTFVQGW